MTEQERGTIPIAPESGPRPGISPPMFGPEFYLSVLPERVVSQCDRDPAKIPVVILHLANGGKLDLCHIAHLTDKWFAVQFFRDSSDCADMDLAFLPYDLVVMVTVSIKRSEERRIGFSVDGTLTSQDDLQVDPVQSR